MIAGEFDLPIGSMIGFAGMMVALPAVYLHWPISIAILFAFVCSMLLGGTERLPRDEDAPAVVDCDAGVPVHSARPHARAVDHVRGSHHQSPGVGNLAQADPIVNTLFHGVALNGFFTWLAHMGIGKLLDSGQPLVPGIPKVIIWWLALTTVGAFVLTKTRYGNWILAVGGNANAAKNVGVPVKRVKISLFVLTAFCSCLFAVLQVCDIGSATDRGLQKEFEAIIAAVIGGTLLTGGYGSVVGACFGALIFGVVQIGITYTNVSSDWFRVFLGMMLLIAVLFNHYVRRRVSQAQ